MDLEVKVTETKPDSYIVKVRGRINSENFTSFEEKINPVIDKKKTKNLVLDLAGLSYISSSGLGVIFAAIKKLKEKGGGLVLCNLQPQIKKVFDIVKALPPSSIFSSVEEADAYLEHIMSEELKSPEDENGKS